MSILKKGASHGYAPRSQICCICDCLLDKNSSSYIRIFNCGHATHLQCEVLENGTSSSSSSSGCPVCMPKKKSQRSRNKSVLPEKSLVKGFSSRTQQIHGTTVHPHESNASENTYGLHQISRVWQFHIIFVMIVILFCHCYHSHFYFVDWSYIEN